MSPPSSVTSPLVGSPAHNDNKTPAISRPGPLASNALVVLGAGRALLGIVSTAIPGIAARRLFRLEVPDSALLPVAMFGAREIVLGLLTLAARRNDVAASGASSSDATASARRESLRRVVLGNIATDLLDVVSSIAAIVTGSISSVSFDLLGGGALLCVVVGSVALRGLRE